jgi:hypothetical protein
MLYALSNVVRNDCFVFNNENAERRHTCQSL